MRTIIHQHDYPWDVCNIFFFHSISNSPFVDGRMVGWKKFGGCKQGSGDLWPQRTPPRPTSVPLFVNLHNGAESPKPQTIRLSLFSLCGRIELSSLMGWGLTGWTESCVVGWGVLFILVMLPPLSTQPERGVWGIGRACGAVRGQGNAGYYFFCVCVDILQTEILEPYH